MISKHSAHSTPQPFGIRTWLWRYTCLLLLISMLWHRQAIFESKGDKLSSSAEGRIRTQGLRHLFVSRLNARWQTYWAIEDQAKNLNSTACPYDQQAFSPLDPTAVWHSHLALAIYMLLISMLWHRQAIFESTGDKLSSSAESRIRTHQGLRHQIASRLNSRWQTDWAIEDQAKNLNSTARPYDPRAFSPLDPTAVWHSHLALAIYMFVVNFDALAQASDIRIERRQVVFICWIQDSNPSGSQTPNRQQTECPLTNRLSYPGSSKNLNSTARPYDQQAFSQLDPTAVWHWHLALHTYMHTYMHAYMHACMHTYIHTYMFVVNFDALAQASYIRIERRQVVFLCWRQDSNPSGSQTPNRQQTECPLTNRLSYRGSS